MDGTSVEAEEQDCNEDYTGAVCLLHQLTWKVPSYREVLIDAEDLELVARDVWFLQAVGKTRAFRVVRRGRGYIHTVLMQPPLGMMVDHIDHRPLDNRKSKMRVCTARENNLNTRGKRTGTSTFKGVSWAAKRSKWYVQALDGGNKVVIGFFEDEVEAARAYNEFARKCFGPYAYLNPV